MPSGADRKVFFLAGAVVLALDAVTKYVAEAQLAGGRTIEVIGDWVRFHLVFNRGAAFGLHRLVETVNYGYWFVGAQNSGAASTGAVEWSRAAVGVDAQAQPTAIEGAAWENGRIQLTFPGAFNTRYGVYATTSSPDRGYACVQSNRVMTKPMETLTIEPADNAAAIYRIGAD
mgnify:CR=1 FL=1